MRIARRTDGSIGSHDIDGLVGKFEHHSRIVAQLLMRCHHTPNGKQILLVFASNEYILWTYSRGTHHDIQSVTDGIFRHRHKYFVKVLLEACEPESRNIVFARCRDSWLIAPIRIHMEAQPAHFPTSIQNLVDKALVVAETIVGVITPTPASALLVEPGRVGLTKSMEVDGSAIGQTQVTSFDMQCLQFCTLCTKPSRRQERQQKDQQKTHVLHAATITK